MTLGRTRAFDPLVEHCGTPKAAYELAREAISGLEDGAFSETVVQRFEQMFDVYGLRKDGVVWFVKLAVDIDQSGEEFLLLLSFHPATRAIKTIDGEVVP